MPTFAISLRNLTCHAAFGTVILSSLIVSPALAGSPLQTPPAIATGPNASADSEATRLFERGLELATRKEFDKAARAFEESFKKGQNPRALFNQAASERRNGDRARAAEHFLVYLSLPETPKTDRDSRDQAKSQLGELAPTLCRITLQGPVGMEAWINERHVNGAVSYAEPGNTNVTLSVSNETVKRDYACKAGDQLVVNFAEKPLATIETHPVIGSVVTAPTTVVSGVGIHEPPVRETKTVHRTSFAYVAAGAGVLGVAGLVLGGVFGANSSSADSLRADLAHASPGRCADPASAACAPVKAAADDATRNHTTSTAMFATGGVLLGVSAAFVLLYLATGKEQPVENKQAHVHIAPSLNGAVLVGQF